MMKNLFCVKDRVVAITGATGVLGRSMVLHFAEQGARVVLMGRKAKPGLPFSGKPRRPRGRVVRGGRRAE